MAKTKANIWVCAFDIHHPEVDWPTFNAMKQFLRENQTLIAGFIFGGDQLDNKEISHHTKNKPLFRPVGSYAENTRTFDSKILTPLEQLIPDEAKKIWIQGNHDDWEDQMVAEQPELQGTVERRTLLKLEERGWEYVGCGQRYRLGKLNVIHGEQLSGTGNQASAYHAKKAVDIYAGSVLYGHMHAHQSYTRILPHDIKQKWIAMCAPIMGATNPGYLRNRPTAWTNGFVIVEVHDNGFFNLVPIIVSGGKFSYGGNLYGGVKK